eukprot:2269006-Amphidinium_carterae.1
MMRLHAVQHGAKWSTRASSLNAFLGNSGFFPFGYHAVWIKSISRQQFKALSSSVCECECVRTMTRHEVLKTAHSRHRGGATR